MDRGPRHGRRAVEIPHPRRTYQIAFVRVLGRFPQQEPLEIDADILRLAALQLGADPDANIARETRLELSGFCPTG